MTYKLNGKESEFLKKVLGEKAGFEEAARSAQVKLNAAVETLLVTRGVTGDGARVNLNARGDVFEIEVVREEAKKETENGRAVKNEPDGSGAAAVT